MSTLYEIQAASKVVGTTTSVQEGWGVLAELVSKYAATLEGEEMHYLADKWRYFREALVEKSLAPWEDTGLIDGPDEHLWGVEVRKHS